jgi:serine O-acetyltransferase
MLRALICSDRCRYGRGNSWLIGYLLFPGFRFSFWFRLHQWANASGKHRLVSVFLTWCVLRQSLKTGIQINPGAQVGPGLYMPHFGGIVVNPKAVIGANCYLSHNVLIGKVHAGKRAGVPVVGDNVFIGAGAVILGNIAIGNNRGQFGGD